MILMFFLTLNNAKHTELLSYVLFILYLSEIFTASLFYVCLNQQIVST